MHAAGTFRHIPRCFPAQRKSPPRDVTPAAPTNEAQEAQIKSETEACTPYSIPEVANIKGQFPTIWQTADLVPGDSAAQSVWQNIQSQNIIPADIKPKGTPNGDFSSFTPTYDHSDPDCWWTFDNCVKPKHPKIPVDVYQCPEPSTWGLTFDDGPNCTQEVLYDFLQQQNQKATMFYIGSNILDWPLQAQRGLVDGHQICVHTWSHQYMTALSDTQVFSELYYTAKAIKDVVGVTPRCWRPPYGDTDDRVRAIATGLGLSTVIWTDDTDDWKAIPAGTLPKASIDANYASIINKESDTTGNIVLTHELNNGTMSEMIEQYPQIKQKFKHIVPITACMNETNPYPESITYPNFASYISGDIEPKGIPSGTDIKVQSASYDPLAAASATAAAGDSTGGSTSSSDKQASAQGQKSTGSGKSAASSNRAGKAIVAVSALGAVSAFMLL
ncbi:glycoside hydrolase/deacetylase [Ceraceosorus guamensis]|uniref:chitin deacetylase n=1 Tax=Ceraceosorus guamensis TaxID=1522189 RepID=A0A316VVQ6_9BASI|nr:glycoside hydrolase/deacetylase [Ceraceosorus guamensis]PWN41028.1 glycoside hydrolase/deacetylase [Ceraceosorus guamensis]